MKILENGVVRDATPEEVAQREADIAAAQQTAYVRARIAEYPSFADQFDLLYHEGMDAWKAAIQAVKDKYPKPE